jgi:hypothetical protein
MACHTLLQEQDDRTKRDDPPIVTGEPGYAPEPQFWMHYDQVEKTVHVLQYDPATKLKVTHKGGGSKVALPSADGGGSARKKPPIANPFSA